MLLRTRVRDNIFNIFGYVERAPLSGSAGAWWRCSSIVIIEIGCVGFRAYVRNMVVDLQISKALANY